MLQRVEALANYGPDIGRFQLAAVGFHPLGKIPAIAVFGDKIERRPNGSALDQCYDIGVPGLGRTVDFGQKSTPRNFRRGVPMGMIFTPPRMLVRRSAELQARGADQGGHAHAIVIVEKTRIATGVPVASIPL